MLGFFYGTIHVSRLYKRSTIRPTRASVSHIDLSIFTVDEYHQSKRHQRIPTKWVPTGQECAPAPLNPRKDNVSSRRPREKSFSISLLARQGTVRDSIWSFAIFWLRIPAISSSSTKHSLSSLLSLTITICLLDSGASLRCLNTVIHCIVDSVSVLQASVVLDYTPLSI